MYKMKMKSRCFVRLVIWLQSVRDVLFNILIHREFKSVGLSRRVGTAEISLNTLITPLQVMTLSASSSNGPPTLNHYTVTNPRPSDAKYRRVLNVSTAQNAYCSPNMSSLNDPDFSPTPLLPEILLFPLEASLHLPLTSQFDHPFVDLDLDIVERLLKDVMVT